MGDISIIARRLLDGNVQYGWSGNGGYFDSVGRILLEKYTEPEVVEYLFGLGEVSHLGNPYSESDDNLPYIRRTHLTGVPHSLGTTERIIFSKIAFIDYGYFYDIDNQWYYVIPGPFRIKVPLKLIENNLDERDYEFDFRDQLENLIVNYILDNPTEPVNTLIKEHNTSNGEILTELSKDDYPVYKMFDKYRWLFDYFDDWIVVECDSNFKDVTGFKMKSKQETHIETIYW